MKEMFVDAREDHPRGCGDMCVIKHSPKRFIGSPPRVRGHDVFIVIKIVRLRITPAGAGTCVQASVPAECHQDHPRGCGDMGLIRQMTLIT